jgi:hypothetical protein
MLSCLDIVPCDNILVIGVYKMVFRRSTTQLLVITTALVFLGTNAAAFGSLPGLNSNCRASTVDCPFSCTVCRRYTCLSNFSELENTCCTACPQEKEQYPAVSLISRIENSDKGCLSRIRYFEPATKLPSDGSYQPKGIRLHHSLADTLVLINCVFLI